MLNDRFTRCSASAFGPIRPADAPTGHGVGFRQTVDGRRAFGHARQTRRADVSLVKQIAVDLVADQPQIVTHAQRRQRLPDQQGKARAGRIIGTVEQHRAGLRRDPRGDIGGSTRKPFSGRTGTGTTVAAAPNTPRRSRTLARRRSPRHPDQQALSDRIHRALRAGRHDHALIHHDRCAAGGERRSACAAPVTTHFGIMRIASQQAVGGRE
jgi:hypothetical protein